jgi:hypothetical protein
MGTFGVKMRVWNPAQTGGVEENGGNRVVKV